VLSVNCGQRRGLAALVVLWSAADQFPEIPVAGQGVPFHDLIDLQTRAAAWSRDVAGTRVHGTTRQVPRVVFETIEQSTLVRLAPEPFDRSTWGLGDRPSRSPHPRSPHPVPAGPVLRAHPLRRLACPRSAPIRGSSGSTTATDDADYPADRAPYAMRAPGTCIRQAEQGGPAVGQFVRVALSGASCCGPGCARPRSCSAWRIASAPPSCCWRSATPAPTILDDFGLRKLTG